MKKLAIFAALCSLTLFTAGCDNSPAAKQADAEKNAAKAEGNALKADIDAAAREDKAEVDEAVKETDQQIDAEKKADEARNSRSEKNRHASSPARLPSPRGFFVAPASGAPHACNRAIAGTSRCPASAAIQHPPRLPTRQAPPSNCRTSPLPRGWYGVCTPERATSAGRKTGGRLNPPQ